MRRTAFTTRIDADPTDWHLLRHPPTSALLLQARGGSQLLCSLSDETPSARATPAPRRSTWRRRSTTSTPSPISASGRSRPWAGLRTFASDRNPVFGWDDAVDGFFWLVGQGGCGIVTSPIAGQLTAALLRGEDLADECARAQADAGDPGAAPDELSGRLSEADHVQVVRIERQRFEPDVVAHLVFTASSSADERATSSSTAQPVRVEHRDAGLLARRSLRLDEAIEVGADVGERHLLTLAFGEALLEGVGNDVRRPAELDGEFELAGKSAPGVRGATAVRTGRRPDRRRCRPRCRYRGRRPRRPSPRACRRPERTRRDEGDAACERVSRSGRGIEADDAFDATDPEMTWIWVTAWAPRPITPTVTGCRRP